jgi:hypothetical protein
LITVILCLVSFAIAALAVAVIFSGGLIVTIPSLYPFAFSILMLGALGLRFPRVGGSAIIFASAVLIIWISFSFLFFPDLQEPVRLSLRSAVEGHILIRQEISAGAADDPGGAHAEETWNIFDDGRTITFEAVSITAYPPLPFIGGQRRGAITRITRNGEQLFVLAGKHFSSSDNPGFLPERHTLDLPSGIIHPGLTLSVAFDGKHLYFDK